MELCLQNEVVSKYPMHIVFLSVGCIWNMGIFEWGS